MLFVSGLCVVLICEKHLVFRNLHRARELAVCYILIEASVRAATRGNNKHKAAADRMASLLLAARSIGCFFFEIHCSILGQDPLLPP